MNSSTLRLKARPPMEDEIENWDDDDFVFDGDELALPSLSNSATNISYNRRDSQSSFRSDFESVHGEEERQVLLPGNDEKSTLDAIAAAAKAGIPLPKNVPPSALMGGTIKRLGGRKIKKIIQEDWIDDLVIPDGQALQIKRRDSSQFPEVLRQVSNSAQPSPSKPPRESPSALDDLKCSKSPSAGFIDLERFRDIDDEDLLGDGAETIRVSKKRSMPKPLSLITPPTPQKPDADADADAEDDFEKDFELPEDGKLKLSAKRDIPKTPTLTSLLDDIEWAEGSLGTRFGGTRREPQSARSSSVGAFSPSLSSSIVESEDEIFDGLIIPNGPLDFGERLKRRRLSRSPERIPEEPTQEELAAQEPPNKILVKEHKEEDKEDFLSGLEIGDGEIFDSRKLTLNRNIQVKTTRPASPARPKASVALKFTNKPVAGTSRLPRPMASMGSMMGHERSHTQSSLEPVSESGGPIPRAHSRRSLSRIGHSAHSSVTSVASTGTATAPAASSTMGPTSPRRRELGQRASQMSLRNDPTTSNSQLLRMKRSLPMMHSQQSPARAPSARTYERPPSRTDHASRAPAVPIRPKTPVERVRTAESVATARKAPQVPFVPAGASASQSHNVNAKASRTLRRHESEANIDFRSHSRAVSRSAIRSPSPPRLHRSVEKTPDRGAWSKLSLPKRVRNFGDGHELDAFDDLPTSTQAEAKYLKQPVTNRPPTRGRSSQIPQPDRTVTPSPRTLHAPRVDNNVPSFARDTAASRIARETNLAQRNPSGVIAPLTAQRIAQLSARSTWNGPPQSLVNIARPKKPRRPPQSKPQLIANLNPPRDPKVVQGMCYNPETLRWEGNDHALNAFEVPASSPSTSSVPAHVMRDRETAATPRPALITNIGATKGVQVVGGMVFDPQNMCWLKLAPPRSRSDRSDTLDGFNALDDDSEEDVFKDIPDLEERTIASSDDGRGGGGGYPRVSDVHHHEWPVGEEFDVGPEFVRRQREEEERWRKKCSLWIAANGQVERGEAWKWAIRDIVMD
ncbi:hypothetical protein VTJ83DRAFT_6656 [Remersonia thermophila]|uniref:Cytokinesis regulator n=1 Tax=Remersonia thermophila TaxID=72144 RepID=A0ABR4D5B4_9PEZI